MQPQPSPAPNQAPYPYMRQPADDEISLLELWQAIWQRKLTLFITTLITVSLGFGYILSLTSVYQAEVLLSPTTTQKSSGRFASLANQYSGLAGLTGISLPTHSSLNTAIATLESRRFIQAFIQDNRLKPLLFPGQWDINTDSWKPRPETNDSWWNSWILTKNKVQPDTLEPRSEQAYRKFKSALSISVDKKTNLVNLRFNWPEPELAAKWANQLVMRINQILREQAIDKAENSIAYLNEQLKTARLDELRVLYAELIQEQTKNITLAKANTEYAFEVLDPAVAPERPIKPKRSMILLLSLIGGLILGVIIALIRNAAKNYQQKMALASMPQHLPQ